MPVFDFNHTPDTPSAPAACTYTVFYSSEDSASPEKPMLILDNRARNWAHHSCGVFTNPRDQTSFEFELEEGTLSADILQIDARFVSLLRWLGENRIHVR
ncbi:MAG: ATP-dependent Lon protease, partial [Lachnospiraceae bacterium]|nr:ATP-dependent Lon protease [Lachnospiraceae bacterium]